jgi:hypothetical protein
MAEEDLVGLITDVKESLEREIHGLANVVRQGFAEVNARFDAQAARLDRHAALWQTGSRWSARMDDWAGKVDNLLEARAKEIAELRSRIEKLESRNGR